MSDEKNNEHVDLDVSQIPVNSDLVKFADIQDKISSLRQYAQNDKTIREVKKVEDYLRLTLHVASVVLVEISRQNVGRL